MFIQYVDYLQLLASRFFRPSPFDSTGWKARDKASTMSASRTPSKTSKSRHNTPSKHTASALASNSHANITLDGFDTSFAKGDTYVMILV
jgi:hypothetical protein